MSKVSAILTLYNRPHNVKRVAEAWSAAGPDELWILGEGKIMQEVYRQEWPDWLHIRDLPTPRDTNGRYLVVPYANKINYALDRTTCDYITYGTDDSWPAFDKLKLMAAALDANPEWGAAYCEQSWQSPDGAESHRGNMGVVSNAYAVIDHTQVMHRRGTSRWSLDGDIRLGDALFWQELHKEFGPFYPVPFVLDRTEQTADGISRT